MTVSAGRALTRYLALIVSSAKRVASLEPTAPTAVQEMMIAKDLRRWGSEFDPHLTERMKMLRSLTLAWIDHQDADALRRLRKLTGQG